ncbi:MAG: PIN domain-containing protein [Anaerolineae bacterium]
MTFDFLSRLIGMIVIGIAGARLGSDVSSIISLDATSSAVVFGLTGVLFGLIITPYLTVHPVRWGVRALNELPVERLMLSLVGAAVGLSLALLLAYPLSLLPEPFGVVLPSLLSLAGAYLGLTTFGIRHREILDMLNERMNRSAARVTAAQSGRKLILDTSVLIDGRIVGVAETGFLGGMLIVPRFVMNELHRVADSSDQLRRNRGRHGLDVLKRLQRIDSLSVRMVEDDFEDITEVDNKLVALAVQMQAAIITNDYNLGQVAELQDVQVLNINQLAKSLRAMYIPGESFAIRIIQEGKDVNQGVGYLDDGTMVVVENGRQYMDRVLDVRVTKLIERDAGRMIFAVPEAELRRGTPEASA